MTTTFNKPDWAHGYHTLDVSDWPAVCNSFDDPTEEGVTVVAHFEVYANPTVDGCHEYGIAAAFALTGVEVTGPKTDTTTHHTREDAVVMFGDDAVMEMEKRMETMNNG